MSKTPRLKIAYLCETNPSETLNHSGGNTKIFNALQDYVGDVTYLGESWGLVEFVRKIINKMPWPIILRLRFRTHWLLSSIIARRIYKELKKQRYDVVFCSYGFYCLSNLKLPYPVPVVFTSDATFTAYKYSKVGQQFESFFSLSRRLDPLLRNAEEKVYQSADLLLWPSRWMKNSVDELFNLSDDKSHMVHWGANILPPSREDLITHSISKQQVELLLVGRDWFPKGGPVVFETLKVLLDKGINAHLSVVGCVPPDEHIHEKMTIYPQLNKNIPEEYETFISLYKNAHFFVMPSYEAYGFAFCEASAYGLPTLCLDVGGVPIKQGVNGHALPDGSTPADFAEKIEYYLNSPAEYSSFQESTRHYYEEHLNWEAWAKKVAELIQNKVEAKATETP